MNITLHDKSLEIRLTKAAQKALALRDTPLVAELVRPARLSDPAGVAGGAVAFFGTSGFEGGCSGGEDRDRSAGPGCDRPVARRGPVA